MRLAALFTDHAVLQRDRSIPVWGWDAPGTTVTASLAGQVAHTVADARGRFFLRLPALPAGGPHDLVVSGSATATARNVLVGEVWVCSGQSNMEWQARNSVWEDGFPANAELPAIRCFTASNPAEPDAQDDARGSWVPAGPRTVGGFSGVGFAFARALLTALGIPVGIIVNAWGGTRVEAWISRASLITDTYGASEIISTEAVLWNQAIVDSRTAMERWELEGPSRDPGRAGATAAWADAAFDDSGWKSMALPCVWQDHGHPGSGIFWFRRVVEVPAEWAGKDAVLEIGSCDKYDVTWFNGEQVGAIGRETKDAWCTQRRYALPGKMLKAGRNVIAVRVHSYAFHGGMRGPAEYMRLTLASDAAANRPIALHGAWRYEIETYFGVMVPPVAPPGAGNPNTATILFNSRVNPLLPYAIRGALWYQGESNEGNPEDYRRLLPMMIRDWRHAWGQGDFPFLCVQLANYANTGSSHWPLVREAQLETLKLPNTGMAVAIDVGNPTDIHPANKAAVGERLARWALATTYAQPVAPSGPLFAACALAGDKLRVSFSHTHGGLVARGGKLKTFEVAGPDRAFLPAEATIEGDVVVVRTPKVPQPVAVRYAWSNNPEGCNLENGAGLPASPFRSDGW
jgi:sialate O-acetylesterase